MSISVVPGHVSRKQAFSHPLLAAPSEMPTPTTCMMKVAHIAKRAIQLISISTDTAVAAFSMPRHLSKILPGIALLTGSPGLFGPFVAQLTATVQMAEVGEPCNDLHFWTNGGFLSALAKQRYVQIAAMSCLVPANIISTGSFMAKVGLADFGGAYKETLGKIALYLYCGFYSLAVAQAYLDQKRYALKCDFYSDPANRTQTSLTEAAFESKRTRVLAKKGDAQRKIGQYATKLIAMSAANVFGVKDVYTLAILNTVALVATGYRAVHNLK